MKSNVDGSEVYIGTFHDKNEEVYGPTPWRSTAREVADTARAKHLAIKAKLRAARLDLENVPEGALILAEARIELMEMDEAEAYREWRYALARAEAVESWLEEFKTRAREKGEG